MISEFNIIHNGWKGSGYIIIDPQTASGAYLISGGLNGGQTNAAYINGTTAGVLLGTSLIAADSIKAPWVFTILFSLFIGFMIGTLIAGAIFGWRDKELACFLLGFFQSLGATLGAIGFLSAGRLGGVYTAQIGGFYGLWGAALFYADDLPSNSSCINGN